jgi:hypothetical protein
MPAPEDPRTPDGPAPHAFPSWPFLFLETASHADRPSGTGPELPADSLFEGRAGSAPAGSLIGALWTLALAPYGALWAAVAAGLGAVSPTQDGPADEPTITASPR